MPLLTLQIPSIPAIPELIKQEVDFLANNFEEIDFDVPFKPSLLMNNANFKLKRYSKSTENTQFLEIKPTEEMKCSAKENKFNNSNSASSLSVIYL